MILVIIFSLGMLAGLLIGIAITRHRPVGDLRVDRSDSDGGPYLFLELDTDVPTFLRKKYVTFRVKAKDFIPHE